MRQCYGRCRMSCTKIYWNDCTTWLSFIRCKKKNRLMHYQYFFTFVYHDSKSFQGLPGCNPPTNSSCQEIHRCFPSAPSGNYQLQLANGAVIETYCDMEGSNCGGEGGWTRVAFVNMTDPGATCPEELAQRNFSGQILCSRNSSTGCDGTTFPTFNLNYCQVCGRLRGYQFGSPGAFVRSNSLSSITLNSQMLMGSPLHMVIVVLVSISGPTLQVSLPTVLIVSHVHAIIIIPFLMSYHQHLLVVTTTVSLLLAAYNQVYSIQMMLCGTGSSVLAWKVPAAATIQTYLGSTQHYL